MAVVRRTGFLSYTQLQQKNNSRTWVVEHDIGRKQKKGSPRTYSVSLPIFLLAALFPLFFFTLFSSLLSLIHTRASVCRLGSCYPLSGPRAPFLLSSSSFFLSLRSLGRRREAKKEKSQCDSQTPNDDRRSVGGRADPSGLNSTLPSCLRSLSNPAPRGTKSQSAPICRRAGVVCVRV